MRIDDIIATADGPIFSFEFMPPKTDEGDANLRATLSELQELDPAFVSVTYGAGGSTQEKTLETTRWLKQDLGLEAMAHLTCVGASVEQVTAVLDDLADAGIENVLALRGDPPRGQTEWTPHPEGLRNAAELVRLIRERRPELGVAGAAFPEVHPQASDPLADLQYLKAKVDAGAQFLITQLFFDNSYYFNFVDAARFAGIDVPILPGIMPITNVKQIKTITGLCGATIPAGLLAELEKREDDPEAVAELGVAYATLQCADLLAHGAPGIHFCTMNKSPATRAILTALKLRDPAAARKPIPSEAQRL
ncbi:MAG TPA: methylenetetrahydrofolate reductase [NAD(P)H] [Solirubrobacteraceae bacterium]|nr:methylenetetrahydrofolate reductase [NAD(P)H] [Solirubrobacteraceae bacterium]